MTVWPTLGSLLCQHGSHVPPAVIPLNSLLAQPCGLAAHEAVGQPLPEVVVVRGQDEAAILRSPCCLRSSFQCCGAAPPDPSNMCTAGMNRHDSDRQGFICVTLHAQLSMRPEARDNITVPFPEHYCEGCLSGAISALICVRTLTYSEAGPKGRGCWTEVGIMFGH